MKAKPVEIMMERLVWSLKLQLRRLITRESRINEPMPAIGIPLFAKDRKQSRESMILHFTGIGQQVGSRSLAQGYMREKGKERFLPCHPVEDTLQHSVS